MLGRLAGSRQGTQVIERQAQRLLDQTGDLEGEAPEAVGGEFLPVGVVWWPSIWTRDWSDGVWRISLTRHEVLQ